MDNTSKKQNINDPLESRDSMEANIPKRNVFFYLLCAMIAFGLFIGLIFPFFAEYLLGTHKALSAQFKFLCLAAGLLVGLVNYLLFHLVISRELDRIIKGMYKISTNIQKALQQQLHPDNPCELEVTSSDRLGEVILAFNSMGHTIDERQRRERQLREAMNTLSDSVDLTFVGQVIITHIPAPPPWQHALLYALVEDEYQCIAMKNVSSDSVIKTLHADDLDFLETIAPDHFKTMETGKTCFTALEIIASGTSHSPSHITIAPLTGDETIIGFIITACHEFVPLSSDNQLRCRTYCDYVQPYLRSTLLHYKIQKLACVDELSQALNRRAGMHRLHEEYSAALRHKFSFSVILFDIDFFKKINDAYGHQTGDRVISELCQRMQTNLRDEDILFRYGGEEFVVILPHIDLTGAALCAERTRYFIRDKPFRIDQNELQVRISLGVVSWPRGQEEDIKPDDLLNLADKALYRAKQQGRDQVAVHTGTRILSFTEYLNSLEPLPTERS